MPEQSNDYRVVVFGAGGVGKSSLVLRFVKGTFRECYIPTIEDTYRQKRRLYIDYKLSNCNGRSFVAPPAQLLRWWQVISCNKNICTLQITDTTGSHQFPAMQRLNISKGHAFVLVYSVTSRQSLEELRAIHAVIREVKSDEDMSDVPLMLVGNKCDEADAREVPEATGAELAKSWKCGFMETSAKTNHNVKELFQELLQMEKRRSMSLNLESKKTRAQLRREKFQGKCLVM
ncbi:RAB3B [Cordylochernes scorpioides]|uniref:RAB3B n=1 Tax=Cordylochernes scorpioides TaxID=51811 RepID=A0ABY6KB69_9ARAC|nr:RAB3B [Cordylochernes scorpioides]